MSIQTRLKAQRYGKHNIMMVNDYEIKRSKIIRSEAFNVRMRRANVAQHVVDIYTNPKHGYGRYKEGYTKLIDDYNHYKGPRHKATLAYNILLDKLIYFMLNKERYNLNFQVYNTSWTVGGLFSMRKHIFARKKLLGEIPITVWDISSARSNGYYPMVKPLTIPYTNKIGDQLYNLLYPYAKLYLDKYHKH